MTYFWPPKPSWCSILPVVQLVCGFGFSFFKYVFIFLFFFWHEVIEKLKVPSEVCVVRASHSSFSHFKVWCELREECKLGKAPNTLRSCFKGREKDNMIVARRWLWLFEDAWNHRRKRCCSPIIIIHVEYQIQETLWKRSDKFPYYSLSLSCFCPYRAKKQGAEQA